MRLDVLQLSKPLNPWDESILGHIRSHKFIGINHWDSGIKTMVNY